MYFSAKNKVFFPALAISTFKFLSGIAPMRTEILEVEQKNCDQVEKYISPSKAIQTSKAAFFCKVAYGFHPQLSASQSAEWQMPDVGNIQSIHFGKYVKYT